MTHVFAKPVRPRLLNNILEKTFGKPAAAGASAAAATAQAVAAAIRQSESGKSAVTAAPQNQNVTQALELMRHFSAILTHSLDAEAMLKRFLLLLRETVGVNRAAIFLRQDPDGDFRLGKRTGTGGRSVRVSQRLFHGPALPACWNILNFPSRPASVVISSTPAASSVAIAMKSRLDAEMQQEFELLGAQVAIPVLDREILIGVAVFDGRITGEPLVNSELELIFHLLEELAMAIKNIWLHDQLAANHEMMADIFRQLSGACVLVGQDLTVIHANKSARHAFSKSVRRSAELEFSDLPPALGSKIYQVLKTGTAIAPFRFTPDDSPNAIFNVSIVPFQKQGSVLPASALLVAEDLTQSEQLRKLGDRSRQPPPRHHHGRPSWQHADRQRARSLHAFHAPAVAQGTLQRPRVPRATRLEVAMADGIKRVGRLINQMRFLARDSVTSMEPFPMEALITDAFEEAQKHQPAKATKLDYKNGLKPIIVTGDRTALKHALSEVMLNALQANPSDPKIGVLIHSDANGAGPQDVKIEIQDNGTGFRPEDDKKIPTPFFTTRNVGLGLGLTVSRKIIERHHGKLEIVTPKTGTSAAGCASIPLPLVPKRPTKRDFTSKFQYFSNILLLIVGPQAPLWPGPAFSRSR